MIYLDNGATSFPKPPGMIAVMERCMAIYCGNPGRSGHDMSMRTGEEVYKARRALAKLFGIVEPERILFTKNATEALNQGIRGVLTQGDHVITTAMEHNSVLRPLKELESEGIAHTIIGCGRDGMVSPAAVEEAIRPNTKLIVCTHASNVTGTIMPVTEIGALAQEHGILFLVDGAQSAGSVPIDVARMNIDLLAVPGHKGLLGPLGTGMLYVREGLTPKPLLFGGTGTESKKRKQPCEFPEGYEAGTINAPGIIGLSHGAEFVWKTGVDRIGKYEEELTRPLDESLRAMNGVTVYGPEDCSRKTAIVTFNVDGKGCEQVAQELNNHFGIAVRAGFHCAGLAHKSIGTWEEGAVRMSPGPFNTKKEIAKVIDAVYKISLR